MNTRGNKEKKALKRRQNLDDQLIHDLLIKMGLIIPQSESDIQLAKEAIERIECPPLPLKLADPKGILHRLNEEDLKAKEKLECPVAAPISLPALLRRLEKIGIDRKLLPRLFHRRHRRDDPSLVVQLAEVISRIFGFAVDAILNPADHLEINPRAMQTARFKLPARSGKYLSAYTVYARAMAMILLEATADLPRKPIPNSPEELRDAIKKQYGSITFEHALLYVWSLGIPVLPLSDRGGFHAACWRVNGRNVIVLKQRVRSIARWLFDLIHEIDHARNNPDQADLDVIDDQSTLEQMRFSPEEKAANRLAGEVALDGRAEELTQICVRVANGKVERFKTVVPKIAIQMGVSVDSLANYVAFRLSSSGYNWWPTASNLQDTSVDPWQIARVTLLKYADFSRLNAVDDMLLKQALMDEAELEV